MLNFEKIRPDSAMTVFSVIAAISMGFALIFFVDKQLFLDLEIIRLSVLSLAVSVIIIMANCMALLLITPDHRESMADTKSMNWIMFAACLQTVLIIGSALLSYDGKEDIKIMIGAYYLIFVFINVSSGVTHERRAKKEQKLKEQASKTDTGLRSENDATKAGFSDNSENS